MSKLLNSAGLILSTMQSKGLLVKSHYHAKSRKVSEGEPRSVDPARLLLRVLYPLLPCISCLLGMG